MGTIIFNMLHPRWDIMVIYSYDCINRQPLLITSISRIEALPPPKRNNNSNDNNTTLHTRNDNITETISVNEANMSPS